MLIEKDRVCYTKKNVQIGLRQMDYIFFGFSSLCLCFVTILLFILFSNKRDLLRVWQVLVAVASALVYYFLNVSVFRNKIMLYYVFNILPQILLFILLSVIILNQTDQDAI